MTFSLRWRLYAAAAGALMSILGAGAVAVATHAHGAIVALLSIAFALGVIAIVAVERSAASAETRRPPPRPVTPFVAQRFARGESSTPGR